ncbi:hypothetical protein LEP1GSC202_1980 [Leptospira yanagawae serovar Saopaulo str. Sao Paulo = ATCC 700523]|uniref:Uncharacterized protein n=1 Tax=Leptospira yanagawae serovar Saopaulo str. Sao Paulo = ATCC 700523 TaxID=1249483 RepID=A0A5E8HE72_9LEPT|nr:hypothetical protein LEP1GSC202_1980 [Leptospira yanagawae serovar Saopaulo str. Sao Paulo = ATCC 700523]
MARENLCAAQRNLRTQREMLAETAFFGISGWAWSLRSTYTVSFILGSVW